MLNKIEKLNSNDLIAFRQLLQVFANVFEMSNFTMPNEEYISNLLKNPDFFVIAAKENGIVVGGLTVYILHSYYNEEAIAYIYDMGVDPKSQGKGIGKNLIEFLGNYCVKNQITVAYVEAESEDELAIEFYRKTNFDFEMQATHFTYDFSGESRE